MTTFVCIVAIDYFYLHYCYWQFLYAWHLVYALLQWTLFCMHCCTHWLLLCSLLQIIIHFICTIPIETLCMNYCKWQLLFERLHWTTFVCTIRSDNFCIHRCILQQQLLTFSNIVVTFQQQPQPQQQNNYNCSWVETN